MCCKTNRNGNVKVLPNPKDFEQDVLCLMCDGAGLVNGRLCGNCNGHGCVCVTNLNSSTHIGTYNQTKEQQRAASLLGVESYESRRVSRIA